MAKMPVDFDDGSSLISTKTGTTLSSLASAINSLNSNQKDTCAINVTVTGGSVYTLRQGWYGIFATFSMGATGYTSIIFVLNGSSSTLTRRTNTYGSSTKTDETLTLTKWVLSYFE